MDYYLSYGIQDLNIKMDEILNLIIDKFDVQYVQRDSDYFGVYYKCEGVSFDMLNIYENNDQLIQFPDRFNLIVDLSIITGKIKDRKSKYSTIKKAFANSKVMELFKDKVVEN